VGELHGKGLLYHEAVRAFQKRFIVTVLRECGWNQCQAATPARRCTGTRCTARSRNSASTSREERRKSAATSKRTSGAPASSPAPSTLRLKGNPDGSNAAGIQQLKADTSDAMNHSGFALTYGGMALCGCSSSLACSLRRAGSTSRAPRQNVRRILRDPKRRMSEAGDLAHIRRAGL
jgi:hypothetical protein